MKLICTFDDRPKVVKFDGTTIEPERDNNRLAKQMNRVLTVVEDGNWHSIQYISRITGDPESSVSARLRDLRKPRWGSRTVERRYMGKGWFQYRLVRE